jgi:tRNA(adenine34) deaminase
LNQQQQRWMRLALDLAERAFAQGEVPVGAIVVLDNQVIGRGFNQSRTLNDPSAHAEILALRDAGQKLTNHRLTGATLICTLEPCAMCVGALVHARVDKLIFAASEPKTGACGSAFDLLSDPAHGHRISLEKGVFADESAQLMRQFFAQRRLDRDMH